VWIHRVLSLLASVAAVNFVGGSRSSGYNVQPHNVWPALQIARRRRAHQEQHPDAKIISLGIGDTTEPLPKSIAEAMAKAASGLATREGYSGYGLHACKHITYFMGTLFIWGTTVFICM
jgi:hypothetical protein